MPVLLDRRRTISEAEAEEPEPDFFQDMTPSLKNPKKLVNIEETQFCMVLMDVWIFRLSLKSQLESIRPIVSPFRHLVQSFQQVFALKYYIYSDL